MSNLVKRTSNKLDNPVTNEAGTAMFYGGLGTLGVLGLSAIFPGSIFFWAVLLIVAGFVLGG